MSPSVNRSSDSPKSSGEMPPETSSVPSHAPAMPTGDSSDVTPSATQADSIENMPSEVPRQQPIPPPSEPMQYRAIGLIRGQYMPSAEQLTRGTLLATDGTLIDAVLLGRVMSLVKNHLSLDQPHLWVVYPRSRQEDGNLHVQIVGVWEPEKLNRQTSDDEPASEATEASQESQTSPETSETLETSETPETPETPEPPEETSVESSEPDDSSSVEDGYFSIRGEVIFHSREEERVIVKIKQSPRKEADKTKFFKLKLTGVLGEGRVIGHFWDLHVQLQENNLLIQEANDIGLLPAKKRPPGGRKFPPRRGGKPRPGGKRGAPNRPPRKGERPAVSSPPKRREPLPKPVKRNDKSGGGGQSGNPSNSSS